MLYREIISVCSQIHTKHIDTLRGQNVKFVNVKRGCTRSEHRITTNYLIQVFVAHLHSTLYTAVTFTEFNFLPFSQKSLRFAGNSKHNKTAVYSSPHRTDLYEIHVLSFLYYLIPV